MSPSSRPLWTLGASDLASAIRERRVTCEEVMDAHLERIDAVNPALNAITVVLREQAVAAAREADRVVEAGRRLGPLHGVPMSVKENIDLQGSATTQGVVALEREWPERDAPAPLQLRRAGAIPVARTNLPDIGLRWHTDNALRGATLNPWDAGRTPGGSSGGEAAAIASGMTPLGIGNDYAGSLRWPAHACGTVALKPTTGRVPRFLSLAPQESAITLQLYMAEAPMARHVRDVRLALSNMCAADARDPWWTPAPLVGSPVPHPIRVAVVTDPAGFGVHPNLAAGVRSAADALANAGYAVEEIRPPGVEEGMRLWLESAGAEIRHELLPVARHIASPDAVTFLDHFLAGVPDGGLPQYMRALGNRNRLARDWAMLFVEHPLVLGPACTEPPFAVGLDVKGPDEVAAILRSMCLILTVNVLGLPAVVLPSGVAGGLPQGVQLIADRFREDLCLDAAETVEQALGICTPIDPLTAS